MIGVRNIGIFAVSLNACVLVNFSCRAAETATVEIKPAGEQCVLIWTGHDRQQEIAAGISGPCALHKTLKGEIRYYKDAGRNIVLIESSQPDPSRGIKSCITNIRAFAYDEQSFVLSAHTSRVASCPPFQWDQKMFTALF